MPRAKARTRIPRAPRSMQSNRLRLHLLLLLPKSVAQRSDRTPSPKPRPSPSQRRVRAPDRKPKLLAGLNGLPRNPSARQELSLARHRSRLSLPRRRQRARREVLEVVEAAGGAKSLNFSSSGFVSASGFSVCCILVCCILGLLYCNVALEKSPRRIRGFSRALCLLSRSVCT